MKLARPCKNKIFAPQALLENLFEVRDEGALRLHAREWTRLFDYFGRLFEHLAHRFSTKQGSRRWGRSQLILCVVCLLSHFKIHFFPAFLSTFETQRGRHGRSRSSKKGAPGRNSASGRLQKWDPSRSRSGFGRALRTGSQAAPAAPPAPRVHSS